MEFKFTLSSDEINVVLRQLDQGPHNMVRKVIDALLAQIKEQQNPPAQEESST